MKQNRNLEITADFSTGFYYIKGVIDEKGTIRTTSFPMKGIKNVTGDYVNVFSNKYFITPIKEEILEKYEKNHKIKFDKKSIKLIDPTIYKMLKDFDRFYHTNYCEEYLTAFSMNQKKLSPSQYLAKKQISVEYDAYYGFDKSSRFNIKDKYIINKMLRTQRKYIENFEPSDFSEMEISETEKNISTENITSNQDTSSTPLGKSKKIRTPRISPTRRQKLQASKKAIREANTPYARYLKGKALKAEKENIIKGKVPYSIQKQDIENNIEEKTENENEYDINPQVQSVKNINESKENNKLNSAASNTNPIHYTRKLDNKTKKITEMKYKPKKTFKKLIIIGVAGVIALSSFLISNTSHRFNSTDESTPIENTLPQKNSTLDNSSYSYIRPSEISSQNLEASSIEDNLESENESIESFINDITVGSELNVDEGKYWESPDIEGKSGNFKDHNNHGLTLSKIDVILPSGEYIPIDVNGDKNNYTVKELKNQYPDSKIAFHFSDKEGHQLGWVDEEGIHMAAKNHIENEHKDIDER